MTLRRVTRGLGYLTLAAWVIFLVALLIFGTGIGDADGFIDCHDACTTWQNLVGYILTSFAVRLCARARCVRDRARMSRIRYR